jgi:hypothetical protein
MYRYLLTLFLIALTLVGSPTYAQTETPPTTPRTIFRTDFSTRADRWRLLRLIDKAQITYTDQGLLVMISRPKYALWTLPDTDLRPSAYQIQVRGVWGESSPDSEVGIVLAYRSDSDLLVATLARDGRIRLGAYKFGVFYDLTDPVNAPEGNSSLNLSVRYTDQQEVMITINDQELLTHRLESENPPGLFGLYAVSGESAGLAITFTEFSVNQLRSQ